MKRVDIDVARTGHFGAGLTCAELDAATQQHGLAVTGGRVSHTGIAGFTLGSGDEGDTRLRLSYGEEKYRKLVALKDTYDPRNVFTLNGNIRPSAGP